MQISCTGCRFDKTFWMIAGRGGGRRLQEEIPFSPQNVDHGTRVYKICDFMQAEASFQERVNTVLNHLHPISGYLE